jgi:hypothetical protein
VYLNLLSDVAWQIGTFTFDRRKYTRRSRSDETNVSLRGNVKCLAEDKDKDIIEYVLGFLDGLTYRWFETLDKGKFDFSLG